MTCFDILEVTISTYFQFFRSSIVTNDNTLFVHLQSADSPHLSDRTFYCMIQCASLIVTIYDNHHFFGRKHSTYTNSQSCLRNFVNIVVKEAGVRNDCIRSQRFLTGTGSQ